MPYLVYASNDTARDRSEREALARGCDPTGTRCWWPVVEGPNGEAVIVTDADDPPRSDGKATVGEAPQWYLDKLAEEAAP